MRRHARLGARGMTLVELMIVVAIIAVIAGLAIVGYARYVRVAKTAEGPKILQAIGDAQEHARATTSRYVDISPNLEKGSLYPAATPGAFRTAWGAACAACKRPWTSLDISVSAPVWFGYATVADTETCDPGCHGISHSMNGSSINFVSLNGGPFTKAWYMASAYSDIDGNGKFEGLFKASFNSTMLVENDGE